MAQAQFCTPPWEVSTLSSKRPVRSCDRTGCESEKHQNDDIRNIEMGIFSRFRSMEVAEVRPVALANRSMRSSPTTVKS